MGADAAADVIFRRELADASNPAELRRSLSQRYSEELTHPFYAAECGYVDDVIDPATREGHWSRDSTCCVPSGLKGLGAGMEIPHCKGAR